jgi:RNA polymerase sigma-70 factor, ECF subfamily
MQTMNFNEIYKAERSNVINYINWKLNNMADAEEVANDVFVKVNKHLNSFDASKSTFSSWLRTITNRCIIDFYRTDHTDHYSNVSDFVNSETGDETFQFVSSQNSEADFNLENSELSAKLLKSFRTLKPKYRKIALLYFVREKQYEEIAEICNVPMGTVKGMISRCREMLQAELKGLYNVRKPKVQAELEA